MSRDELSIGEIWSFLKVKKAWWLTPIIITLIFIGALILFGQGGGSPLTYNLF